MKIQDIKTDLHAHGWCGQEPGFGQFALWMLGERGERNLQTLAERGFKEKVNTLIGLVNFDDTRYQKIVNTRGQLPNQYRVYDDHKERFVGVYDSDRGLWNFSLRGQEVPTDQGHLLVLGSNKEIQEREIEDVLKRAEDNGALIIGDHILAEIGTPGKLFNMLTLKKYQRYSLGMENVERYKDRIHFIEYSNSNVPRLTKETTEFGREVGIPGVFSSDSHTLDYLFSSHMVIPELDFSDWGKLKQGIIESVGSGDIIKVEGRNRIFEHLYHVLAVIYNIARQRSGIVKQPMIDIE